MITTTKVKLVGSVLAEYSLSAALSAAELPKSTWYYHQQSKQSYSDKYQHLRPLVEQVIIDHPDYGIPRITKEL